VLFPHPRQLKKAIDREAMWAVIAGATPICTAIERILWNRDFSRIGRIEDFRSAIDESAPSVVGTHGKVLRQTLFQTELHGVIDRRRAIASLPNHTFGGVHAGCAHSASHGHVWITIDCLKQGCALGSHITEGERKVAGKLALELQ